MFQILDLDHVLLGQAAQQAQGGGPLQLFGMVIFMFIFMWLFLWRPQKIKEKKHLEAVTKLKKGDEVLLESGIYGEVFSVDKETVMVKIADKVVIKVHQRGVRLILTGENVDQDAKELAKKGA